MWTQANFPPDAFWHQTPWHFQTAMEGVRNRMEAEREMQTAQAYESGAFAGLAQHGKLKPLRHYIKPKGPQAMSNVEMLANMRILADRANRKFA